MTKRKPRVVHPQFTILGEKKDRIWTPGIMRPEFARHMRPQIRRLIGLWSQPGQSVTRSAELCGLTPGEFLYLNRALRKEYAFTQYHAVRFCLRFGLPASASVEFPLMQEKRSRLAIRCQTCEMEICALPCVRCWKGKDDDPQSLLVDEDFDESQIAEPDIPTEAEPGSQEKINVLMTRAALVMKLWHPDDNKIYR